MWHFRCSFTGLSITYKYGRMSVNEPAIYCANSHPQHSSQLPHHAAYRKKVLWFTFPNRCQSFRWLTVVTLTGRHLLFECSDRRPSCSVSSYSWNIQSGFSRSVRSQPVQPDHWWGFAAADTGCIDVPQQCETTDHQQQHQNWGQHLSQQDCPTFHDAGQLPSSSARWCWSPSALPNRTADYLPKRPGHLVSGREFG